MRKALTFALTVALAATFVTPLTVLAQTQTQATAGIVAGRSVDAMGRGIVGERVELVRDTQVVNSVTTNGLGEWSFRSVEPGVYVVRMNVRGRIAGVRVTVAAGQAVAGTMIVVPAATAAMQLGTLANLAALFPTAAAATTAVATSAALEVETTELSPALLVQILTAMPQAEREAFAAAVVAAISTQAPGSGTFSQYTTQFTAIANGATTIPTFPPPVPSSGL